MLKEIFSRNSDNCLYWKARRVKNLKTTPNETGAPGADLDVPGAELDDSNEEIGEEDEENNYYSLGGDNHDNG